MSDPYEGNEKLTDAAPAPAPVPSAVEDVVQPPPAQPSSAMKKKKKIKLRFKRITLDAKATGMAKDEGGLDNETRSGETGGDDDGGGDGGGGKSWWPTLTIAAIAAFIAFKSPSSTALESWRGCVVVDGGMVGL